MKTKPTPTEARDWAVNKAYMPPVNDKIRYCKECNKKLSRFNTGRYCFNHQGLEQVDYYRMLDEKRDETKKLLKKKLKGDRRCK